MGSLFVSLKSDIVSLHLMNKMIKEDQKKYIQDFQLKLTDKVALLDAKLTRVLNELEFQTIMKEPKKEPAKVSKGMSEGLKKYWENKRKEGKKSLPKSKPRVDVQPESYPQI